MDREHGVRDEDLAVGRVQRHLDREAVTRGGAWAVMRTDVVGRSRVNCRELPSGKMNLSLTRVTTTVTGYGAEESTVTGMAARCAVKVTVRSVARVICPVAPSNALV